MTIDPETRASSEAARIIREAFDRYLPDVPQPARAEVSTTLCRALATIGSPAREQVSVAIHLAQGLAMGALSGEELRVLREAALGHLLARGLGVELNELKALGRDGGLTPTVIAWATVGMKGLVDEPWRIRFGERR